jgi:hypothetical protein
VLGVLNLGVLDLNPIEALISLLQLSDGASSLIIMLIVSRMLCCARCAAELGA